MNQFEDLVHTARREQGELSVERFAELWAESQTELFGDSVEVTDGYRSWWSYIPHIIGSPGYVYAYAYGQLLALSVYERYEQTGAELVPRYLELLAAGGSRSPSSLARWLESTSQIRASGSRALIWSSASSPTPKRPPRPPGACSAASRPAGYLSCREPISAGTSAIESTTAVGSTPDAASASFRYLPSARARRAGRPTSRRRHPPRHRRRPSPRARRRCRPGPPGKGLRGLSDRHALLPRRIFESAA